MRVLTLTNMYPAPGRRGWGAFVAGQVESLRAAGVETDVMVIDGYRSRLEYLRAIPRLRAMVRSGRYDLIHAHFGLSGLVARCQLALPVIVSYCGDDVYGKAGADGRTRWTSLPLAWLQRALSAVVAATIVKSEAMTALVPAGTPAVIPNGVDLALFRPLDREACRRELGLDGATRYVLFPYDPTRARKNFASVAAAIDALNAEADEGTDEGADEGVPAPRFEALMVHGTAHERMPTYMAAADVLVLASFWEGSPNVVKEALACDMRIVASEVGDVRERLDGVAGTALCSTDPASIARAVRTVLADSRAPDGRERVKALSVRNVAGRVIALYRDVLAGRDARWGARRGAKHGEGHGAGRRRRVLMIVENLPVPFDRRVWQEATALRDDGWTVSVICPKRDGYAERHETIDGIEVFRHPLFEADGAWGYLVEYPVALFWQSWLAWKLFARSGFDVVHACNPPDLIFLVALPFRLLGKRFVFDHHDLCPELADAKFAGKFAGKHAGKLAGMTGDAGPSLSGRVIRRLLLAAERATFRLADLSIATNESYRDIAIERGGMRPGDVYVVRSAPDAARWAPAVLDAGPAPGSDAHRTAGSDAGGDRHDRTGYRVGYVGVMGAQEGLADLIAVIDRLVNERGRDDIEFVLIGAGSELERLKADARERGIAGAVRFTGRVPDAELVRLLRSCELCVNPDPATVLNALSSMNKIVEYMALARPMVQFDLKEGRFTAREASLYAPAGDLAAFGDAIETLLADPARRRSMGEAGRRRFVETLAWEHQIPVLRACYDRLAEPRGIARGVAREIARGREEPAPAHRPAIQTATRTATQTATRTASHSTSRLESLPVGSQPASLAATGRTFK